jgi:hypothetical protein
MGDSYVNYQIRTTDPAAVVAVAEQYISARALVSPERNGWVTIYDETSDQPDQAEIDRLAHDLSLALRAPLFVFFVHDSVLLAYFLFDEEGCLIDEFNSAPDYFGDIASDEARQRLAGNPISLEPYCKSGTSRADIEAVLNYARAPREGGFATSIPADQRLRHLAAVLGIDGRRATLGFNLIVQSPRLLPDAADYTRVHTRRRRPNPRNQVLPRIPPKR